MRYREIHRYRQIELQRYIHKPSERVIWFIRFGYRVFSKCCVFPKNSRKFAASPLPSLGCCWLIALKVSYSNVSEGGVAVDWEGAQCFLNILQLSREVKDFEATTRSDCTIGKHMHEFLYVCTSIETKQVYLQYKQTIKPGQPKNPLTTGERWVEFKILSVDV